MEEHLRDIAEAQRAIELLQAPHLLSGLWPYNFSFMDPPQQMVSIQRNLGFLRSFLKWVQDTPEGYIKFRGLVKQIRSQDEKLLDAANYCKSHPAIGEPYFQNRRNILYHALIIDYLVKQIKSTGLVIEECSQFGNNGFSVRDVPEVGDSSRYNLTGPGRSGSHISMGEKMIGFNDEIVALLDRLLGNEKQLQIISITGMAGIGKTTLAQTLYNNQSVVPHFHIRGWASVSQIYHKRNLFSSILSCIPGQRDSLSSVKDEDVEQKLFKCLKGHRYLIVIDDIWDIGVWYDIKMCFPDDANGSRILFTTRITNVASSSSIIPPCCLRFLNPGESWQLFTHKIFAEKSCPDELMEIGKEIVAKCKGLPLAIVVIAGLLLKKEKTSEIWSHVAKNIGPLIDSDEEQIVDILALSYEHLPQRLKQCFLYLGTFGEDYEIPVNKLVWSWIERQYIKETGERKRLEDIAEEYLMELINRSLVIVAKRRSTGETKTCHIHDMVRKFCIRKSWEHELIIPPPSSNDRYSDDLIVLDLRHETHSKFPMEVLALVHLKYLALEVVGLKILPRRLYFLQNLETFILLGEEKGRRIIVPSEIWKMKKIRHMESSGDLEFEHCPNPTSLSAAMSFSHFLNCLLFINPPSLLHLQTISRLSASGSVNDTLARTPNLRKVGFHLTFSSNAEQISFPDLASLKLLECLKFEYQTLGMKSIHLPHLDKFPTSLKKLTLIGSHVNWEQMSILGMLPNLEILKIKDNFFSGPRWETRDDGFRCLRFLKLSDMDLKEWITSGYHFPKLEQLVLNACMDLVEIPSAIGDICTLQVIEVYRSSSSVVDSAGQIQESQRDLGNDLLKVFIYRQLEFNNSV